MTYIDAAARATVRRTVMPADQAANGPVRADLTIRGQGTIAFAARVGAPFTLTIWGSEPGVPRLRWRVDEAGVSLARSPVLPETEWTYLPLAFQDRVKPAGLDPSSACTYWFSFDCHNRAVIYGKGEMRLGTSIAFHQFPMPEKDRPDESSWLMDLQSVEIDAVVPGKIDIWRDPVTVEPPLRVVPHDAITMDDIAEGRLTVPASLTPVCQKLYDNVAGASFILDTPDFPLFSAAIKASIDDPDGWCRKVLEEKAAEFGDPPNIDKTYLRITLGTNQGESPGIPFVMEIWPGGHYSPIHNHGGANAVIRVLHGEITVRMFPFLSPDHVHPFAVDTFVKEDVTWISAGLNQVHQLINLTPEPCITIQCYLYDEGDRTHWPYFDYLDGPSVEHFDPNSDATFLDFKRLMKAEWEGRALHPAES